MKNLFKISMGALALTAAASFAGQYPFPQNMKSPHGYTIPFASTKMIQEHYNLWKGAWYKDKGSEGWVLSPEGTNSTVSEGIAYGMLITVYMDDEAMFKKLYTTWKSHNVVNGGLGGMHWRIYDDGRVETGSATDADVDAALALVMASKQWNDPSYLDDAKSIISWIGSTDIGDGNRINPGSGWDDMFNPSYAATANFHLFQEVSKDSKWSSVNTRAYQDLEACQNSTSGLVSDWCDWSSHNPTKNYKAAVAQDEEAGFYDDAARTPWRMAWAYYWYGDTKAQAFNKKIVDWMIPATHTASGINSGYLPNGTAVKTEKRGFVSSTFSGGMGMAASSVEGDAAEAYMKSVYKVLKEMTSCETANGCGENVSGEKYYPATLNILYLLLISGNMPNFYNMDGFTPFTPDPSLETNLADIEGKQLTKGDTSVGISGYWNWGAYHDKWENTGTVMSPDSGTSPLFIKDGIVVATASMSIGPEPKYNSEDAKAGHYPSAGIAMSFLKSEEAVDFTKYNIQSIRLTYKSSGPMRMAVLNTAAPQQGAEPGCFLPIAEDYGEYTFSLKLNAEGKEEDDCSDNGLTFMSWVVSGKKTVTEEDLMKTASGVKFEVKVAKGGEGAITIKSMEFLDASGNVVAPEKLVGFTLPEFDPNNVNTNTESSSSTNSGSSSSTNKGSSSSANTGSSSSTNSGSSTSTNIGSSSSTNPESNSSNNQGSSSSVNSGEGTNGFAELTTANLSKISVSGMNIMVESKAGADIAVFSMQGKVIVSGKATFGNTSIRVPNKGVYMVRVGNKISKVNVK